jgi:hypothetical protein
MNCYRRIIYVPLGKIISGQRKQVKGGVERNHLRFLRREGLRWQRECVITAAEGLSLIWGLCGCLPKADKKIRYDPRSS